MHAGPGNNGGDAWVVAAALARVGVPVTLQAWGEGEPRTDDARFERDRAFAGGPFDRPHGGERLVVDGLLGTGATGEPRGGLREGVLAIRAARARGATVVALDVPTGLDATTGAIARRRRRGRLTLTFGTLQARAARRARRRRSGRGARHRPRSRRRRRAACSSSAPMPRPLAIDAHKGTRGRLAIVGGGAGMAGAALLAARAALASGAGLVRLCVAAAGVPIAQGALPAALAAAWPADAAAAEQLLGAWPHAVLLGPGLGGGRRRARALRVACSTTWRGPVVLDADALNAFAGDLPTLAALLGGRPALLTPHPLEFARLAGVSLDEVLDRRFELPRETARALGAAVLLKGVPTVVADAHGTHVVATGAPALATGGSGDVLGGIAATLLAQVRDPDVAALAAEAAWVHDRAGGLAAAARGGARGATLDDVLAALGDAWPRAPVGPTPYPVLAELPAVLG